MKYQLNQLLAVLQFARFEYTEQIYVYLSQDFRASISKSAHGWSSASHVCGVYAVLHEKWKFVQLDTEISTIINCMKVQDLGLIYTYATHMRVQENQNVELHSLLVLHKVVQLTHKHAQIPSMHANHPPPLPPPHTHTYFMHTHARVHTQTNTQTNTQKVYV